MPRERIELPYLYLQNSALTTKQPRLINTFFLVFIFKFLLLVITLAFFLFIYKYTEVYYINIYILYYIKKNIN